MKNENNSNDEQVNFMAKIPTATLDFGLSGVSDRL